MAEIWFYQLETRTLDDVAPVMLEKALERGWRAVLAVGTRARAEALDRHLWTFRDEAFLPHGLAHEPDAGRQPVLVHEGLPADTDRPFAVFADGVIPAGWQDMGAIERAALVFDGRDADALGAARAAWTAAKDAGHDLAYWQETGNGGWARKA